MGPSGNFDRKCNEKRLIIHFYFKNNIISRGSRETRRLKQIEVRITASRVVFLKALEKLSIFPSF